MRTRFLCCCCSRFAVRSVGMRGDFISAQRGPQGRGYRSAADGGERT
jgi:hypothetical protein